MGDVGLMPLYYDLDPALLKGVKGVTTSSGVINLADVFAWDEE